VLRDGAADGFRGVTSGKHESRAPADAPCREIARWIGLIRWIGYHTDDPLVRTVLKWIGGSAAVTDSADAGPAMS
jgi:hypothetical protein